MEKRQEIDSACDPKIDSSLFSVEFFSKGVPDKHLDTYLNTQKKEIYSLKSGGQLVLPPYAAVPRIKWEKKSWWKRKKGESNYEKNYWNDYRSIAKDWGQAMAEYKRLKKEFEKLTGRNMTLTEFFISPLYKKGKEFIKNQQLKNAYRNVVYHYARIQIADLYAHFSPVEFIHEADILDDGDFKKDALGNTNIWERIKKAGENKFYRMEYADGKIEERDLTDKQKEQRRKEAKGEIEGKLINKQISTSIANTNYINDVIKTYVHNDTEAKKQLYHEPIRTEKEIAAYEKLMKQLSENIPEPLRKATEMKMPSDQEIEKIQKYMQSLDNE